MVQAFALTVVDFDGAKLSQLASDLRTQGYAVSSPVSVFKSDEAPAASADAASAQEPAAAVEDTAAAGDTAATSDAAAGASTVEEGTFKCPACGATFAEQVTCANQHPETQTLPTADVNAGAPPQADAAATADGGSSSSSTSTDGAADPAAGGAASSGDTGAAETAASPPAPAGGFPA